MMGVEKSWCSSCRGRKTRVLSETLSYILVIAHGNPLPIQHDPVLQSLPQMERIQILDFKKTKQEDNNFKSNLFDVI